MSTLVTPATVRMAQFTIPRTPPGNNDAGLKSKQGRIRLTKEWRELVDSELCKLDLPRPIPMAGPLRAVVTLRFRVNRGQEWPNYFDFFVKRLGDCLRGGHPSFYGLGGPEHAAERARIAAEHPVGWIVDDKDHLWRVESFAINRSKPAEGERRAETTVRLFWLPVGDESYADAA